MLHASGKIPRDGGKIIYVQQLEQEMQERDNHIQQLEKEMEERDNRIQWLLDLHKYLSKNFQK
jgi:SMC interacting uncharacterized protein involved in chromosome segregation